MRGGQGVVRRVLPPPLIESPRPLPVPMNPAVIVDHQALALVPEHFEVCFMGTLHALRQPGRVGFILLEDESLAEGGVESGSIAVVDLQAPPKEGALTAVIVGDDVLVRYLYFEGPHTLRLEARNRHFEPLILPAQSVTLIGPVLYTTRIYNARSERIA